MTNSIIHFLLFEIFFSLFEPDLDFRLRIAGSLSRGLPSFGAVSLPRGLPSSKQDSSAYCKGEASLSQVDVERVMLR